MYVFLGYAQACPRTDQVTTMGNRAALWAVCLSHPLYIECKEDWC